jgi:hypothetical protein
LKKRCYLIIVLIIIALSTSAQSRWLKEYFPGLNVVGKDLVETYDKGFLLAGWFEPNYPNYIWLLKTDINGTIIWNKTFGMATTYIAFLSLDADSTGNIFLSGGTGFYDSYSDPFVMKLNACGEKEWCLDFNTPGHYDYAHSIVATDDGGCAVILRYTGITPPQTDRICLGKIDSLGNLLWKHCYNSPDTNLLNEDAHSLLLTMDKGYLITGKCDYLDSITNLYWVKPYLIKTDSLGNFEWERVIHAYADNYTGGSANYSTISPSGQFYYTSISHYYYNPEIDRPALGKLDLNGNVIGTYDIIQGFSNGGMSSAQFINDSTLAADCGWGNSMEDFGHYLALIDTLGKIVDTILISQDIYSGVLHLCHDNKLVDMYNTYQNNQFDVYLRKLNYNLEEDTLYSMPFTYDSLCPYQIVSDTIVQDDCGVIVGVEEPGGGEAGKQGGREAWKHGGLEIWPNPAAEMLNVECSMLNAGSDYKLVVYDIFGRPSTLPRLGEGRGGGSMAGDRGWQMDVSALPPGIYFISVLQNGKRIAGGKFIIAR